MPFFLEKLGVKLIECNIAPTVQKELVIDLPEIVSIPSISSLGFEIIKPCEENAKIDYTLERIRSGVFNSFKKVLLLVQDTKATLSVYLHCTDDALVISVPSVNKLCSKLHVEDIVTDVQSCTHEQVGCSEIHIPNGSWLIEYEDYKTCSKDDAILRVHNARLYFRKGTKWIKLNVPTDHEDGFYTIDPENFLISFHASRRRL